MKKIVMIVLGLNVYLFAQGLSCAKFVTMSEQEVKSEISKLQNGINLNGFQTDPNSNEKVIMSDTYGKTTQLTKCMHLRKSLKYGVEDARRYKALLELDTSSLSSTEYKLYHKSITQSITHYKALSNVSVVGLDCQYPLVYTTIQNSTSGVIAYEQRLINGKIELKSKLINPDALVFTCSGKGTTSYLNYMKQNKGIVLTLLSKKDKHESFNINDEYSTKILLFKVKNYDTNKKEDIPMGAKVKVWDSKQYANGKVDIIFWYKRKRYIINSYKWQEAIGEAL